MDGNGRWATRRGLPREAGHRAGAGAVRRVAEAAYRLGIGTLTLFAFSGDNWQRPAREVNHLLALFEDYLRSAKNECIEHGIRLGVIGRRDRFPESLRTAAESAEAATSVGTAMHLRIALDYSGRAAILRAAQRLRENGAVSVEAFTKLLAEVTSADGAAEDVDLLIRTGGEKRLSDFMLWECAYAEMIFTDRMWPDFDASDLEAALEEFQVRERRFGRIPTEGDHACAALLSPADTPTPAAIGRSPVRPGAEHE
jgi:undecaprenyl diphosphate synthase